MCTTKTTTENFGKVDTTLFNYKAIGFAYSISCGDGDYEAEIIYDDESDYEKFEDFQSDIYDFAHNWTNCNLCGVRMKYLVIILNIDTDTIHIVGRDCGDTITHFGIIANRLADKSARAMKVAENKIARKKFLAKYVGLEQAFQVKNKIISDIYEKFIKYQMISEKQVELVFKIAEKQKEINLNSTPIDFSSTKNMSFEVVSLKIQESFYGIVTKILLKNSLNQKLYGNLPNSSDNVVVGDKVKLTTNSITISGDDTSFGFFKRATIKKE